MGRAAGRASMAWCSRWLQRLAPTRAKGTALLRRDGKNKEEGWQVGF